MARIQHTYGLAIMISIFIFSLIHLGVGIGIIAPYREYQDMFRPQIGLASFNLVICIFGFFTSGLGIFALLKNADRFARIVVLIAGALAVFTLASLITALVINARSLSYLSNHYKGRMITYKSIADSRKIIDDLHNRYDCCGNNGWIDWAQAGLDTVVATTTTGTATTTGAATTNPVTTAAATTNPVTSVEGTTNPITTAATDTATISTATPSNADQLITDTTTSETSSIASSAVRAAGAPKSLHRRQSSQETTTYRSVPGLPTSFVVTLPGSCCRPDAAFVNGTGFCLSSNNGTENKIYTDDCLEPLDVTAGNQAMGIGVINCFMLVLAIIGIPALLETSGPTL